MYQVAAALKPTGLPQLSTRAGAFDQANVALPKVYGLLSSGR